MFRSARTFRGIALLAAAAVLVTPAFSQAQHSGGHPGGIGHFGGHLGGYHGGSMGSYRGGSNHRAAFAPYGYGNRHPFASTYRGFFPSYGFSDSYPYAGYDGISVDSRDGGLGTTADPGYADVTSYYLGGPNPPTVTGGSASPGDSYEAFYPQLASTAAITVKVPADAQVWFDGVPMKTTGSVRTYQSPSLAPGQYHFEVRARWTENGQAVTQTQQLVFTPGSHAEADFPMRAQPVPIP